jgi:hypothetical protein
MNQATSPFGTQDESPVMPETEAVPESRRSRKVVLLVAGGIAVLAAAGAGAVWALTSAQGEDLALGGPTVTAPTTSPTATATATAGPTTVSTSAAVNARNPFAARDLVGSGSGGGAAATPAPVTTVTVPVTVTTSATVDGTWVSLFDVDAGTSAADIRVNGDRYTPQPGDAFGSPQRFRYLATATVSSQLCARISYISTTFTLCPGEMRKVG